VREAGLNIMMSMKGDGKPVSFIEDAAVDLDDLPDYTERLNEVFARHRTKGTWYAHASVGCLHVRPVLNMKDSADVARMRAIAEECFGLVRAYRGSHSGEHGDGIARSEFHAAMFGSQIVHAFEAVKDAFDPTGLFNPGRIVRAPRMDDRSLLRYPPDYRAADGIAPALDWSAWPGPIGGLLGAVEMCNNNGTCRTRHGGVMCPSYRATRDERDVTRGRANTLRLALTGQLGRGALASDDVADVLALCVSCKGCKRECPTGVDMARLKIEVLAARATRGRIGLRERVIAALPAYAPAAARLRWLANLRNRSRTLAALGERGLGLAADRPLPEWSGTPFRDDELPRPTGMAGEVLLFADTFNRYFEPDNARAAITVLTSAGFRPVRPRANGRPLCCGRTRLAAGQVEAARAEARRMIAAFDGDLPVIGLEPSCLLTLRDEFRVLLPGPPAEALAGRARLIDEFLVAAGRIPQLRPLAVTAHVHGHCHQKAFDTFAATLAMLGAIPGLAVRPIDSSCCGMAGAFGYQAETLAVSRAMAEDALLPALRAAPPDDLVLASGTSCRHQIRDFAGRVAEHPIRVLARALT
jgi:Fe-S oxidoreductase